MHIVVAANYPDGHVRPFAVELVSILQIRRVPAAVLVGQHEHDRAYDTAQDLLLLVKRHQRVERQFQALVAGENALVVVAVHTGQRSTGQYASGFFGQPGRPNCHHFVYRLAKRVRWWLSAKLSPVQRLRVIDSAAHRSQRVAYVHRPGPHGVQHNQATDTVRVDARQPRAQLSAKTVSQIRQLGPSEVIHNPFDRGQIVGELKRHMSGEMVGTAVARQVDAHVIIIVRQ